MPKRYFMFDFFAYKPFVDVARLEATNEDDALDEAGGICRNDGTFFILPEDDADDMLARIVSEFKKEQYRKEASRGKV